ncbi:MAG TPA: GxxExxY protein [Vicinamibacterales bacterium]|nr:GxxExxY protein [Vicinamibacterales bacterium]
MSTTTATAETLNRLTSSVLDAAIRIHRALGPGLLESAYLACLEYELTEDQLQIERQRAVPLVYKGVRIDCGFRADIVVECSVLIEVKAQEAIAPIHTRQLQTYLRLGQYPVGLLLNFGAPTMKAGIRRMVNGFPDQKLAERAEGAG